MKKHEILWFSISSVVAIANLALQLIAVRNNRANAEYFSADEENLYF